MENKRGAEGDAGRTCNKRSKYVTSEEDSYTMSTKDGSSVVLRNMKNNRFASSAKDIDVPSLTPEQVLNRYTKKITRSRSSENCSICMCSLQEPSGFCEEGDRDGTKALELELCSHRYHLVCVKQMLSTTSTYLECPICKTIHGIRIGNQPPGLMDITESSETLPGHPDCGTIVITYFFQNGTQGPEHPEPGQPYRAHAFPRRAFLPDNERGQKVLSLLLEAWKRRLIFTIGTSVTSGLKNVITWNEIHHKTSIDNFNGHGYPDPAYLDNVIEELALQGVTEASVQQ